MAAPTGLLARVKAARQAFAAPTPAAPPALGRETAWANVRQNWDWSWLSPYNPSALVGRYGLPIFEKMAKDDQIKAALAFKKRAIVAGGWEIQPPETPTPARRTAPGPEPAEPPTEADPAAPRAAPEPDAPTAFVEAELERLPGTLEKRLVEILSALDYGYSLTELVWAPRDDGRIGLEALKTRGPHGLTFVTDPYGNLTEIRQRQAGKDVPLDPEKFLVYVHDGTFGNWYGTSDLESAYRSWWLKENLYRWFGMYLEGYAIPWFLLLYEAAAYAPDKQRELRDFVTSLQAATRALLPKAGETGLEIWQPTPAGNTKEVFEPAFRILDQHIARALLMPGLLGFTADQAEGSMARATVHFDVFLLVAEAARNELAEAINERIVRPLVDFNFTVPADGYPTFAFKPLVDDVRLDLLTAWGTLTGQRVVRRQVEDEDHIRALLKFPKAGLTPMPQPEPPPGLDPTDPNADDPDAEADAAEDGAEMTAAGGARRFALARAKTRYERSLDFAALADTLDRREASAHAALRAAYTVQRDQMRAWVTRKASSGYTAKDVAAVKLRGQAVVKTALTSFLTGAFEAGQTALRAETPRRTMALGGPGFVPREALAVLKAKALELASTTDARLLAEVKRILLHALEVGELPAETIGKLRAAFEPYVGNPDVLRDNAQIAPRRLENLLRTSQTEAYNRGRLLAARDPDLDGLIQGMQYSAILDERTCFAEGTLVHLTHGARRAIETIAPGDIVVSGSGQPRLVLGTKRAFATAWRVIRCADGSVTRCTPTHPFWTLRPEGAGWVEAGALSAGDQIGTGCLPDLRQTVPVLRGRPEAEVLQSAVLPRAQEARGMASPQVPVVRDLVHGADHLREAQSGRGPVLLADLHADGASTGAPARGDAVYLRAVRQGVREETASGAPTPLAGAVVLAGLPPRAHHARVPDLSGLLRDARLAAQAVLLGGLLPEVGSGDAPRSARAGGVGADGAVLPAGSAARPVCGGLPRAGSSGDRGGRAVLALDGAREGVRCSEGEGDPGEGLAAPALPRAAYRHLGAPHVSAGPDHAPRPHAVASTTVVSIETIHEPGWCYDLEIESDHSYLVESGLIVHNTEVCRHLDGKVMRMSDPDLDRFTPPMHVNCRSLLVPVTVGMGLDEADILTPSQAGRAKELAGKGFV